MSCKTSRRWSEIWNHFTDLDDKRRAKCLHCENIISIVCGSLGNLKRHMKKRHPTISISSYATNEWKEKDTFREYVENIITEQVLNNTNFPASSPNSSVSIAQEEEIKPISFKMVDEQLLKMIIKEFHSPNLVEGLEFKKFVELLCPNYWLPTRKVILEHLLTMYDETYEQVKENVKNYDHVCLMIDSWTSVHNQHFMAITGHFINSNFNSYTALLQSIEFPENHNSTNISNILQDFVTEWNIQSKVECIISNNNNITEAVEEIGWTIFPCFGQTINTIVQNSLKNSDANFVIEKIRSTVSFFKTNSHAFTTLRFHQNQIEQTEIILKHDNTTRWTSTYEMIESILHIKEAVTSTLEFLHKQNNLYSLTPNEWDIAQTIMKVLEIFKLISDELSAEQFVHRSKIIVFINLVNKKIQTFLRNENLNSEIISLLNTIKQELDNKFQNIEDNKLTAEATILDPRFKSHGFSDEEKYKIAYINLEKELNGVYVKNEQIPDDNSMVISIKTESNSLLWEDFDAIIQNQASLPSIPGVVELRTYIQESLIDRNSDPLVWWKTKQDIYPRLFQIAKRRLCAKASSIPCVNIFTKDGQISVERRNNLKDSKMNEIVFLNQNLK